MRSVQRAKTKATPQSSPAALQDLDTQLMLQARGGDADAANTLIRRNFERIGRYISRLVHDARPVEDLTQDVFLQAFTHADRYQPTAKVTTWLYRIATNTALNYLKQPERRRRVGDVEPGVHEPATSGVDSPDRQLSLSELQQRVAESIAALPTKQRVALTLFQYEGCSYEQIAVVLDVSVEAVRSLLMRARTTLRRQLHGLI